MKKMNFTNPRLAKNWLTIVAILFAVFNFTQINAQNSCSLSMDPTIDVYLDDTCGAQLTMEIFLSDDGASCDVADHYEFKVLTQDGSTVVYDRNEDVFLNHNDIGHTYMIILWAVDDAGNDLNSAMGEFSVFDKIAPIIDCPTDTIDIQCYQEAAYTPVLLNTECGDVTWIKTNEVVWNNNCTVDTIPPTVFRIIDRWYVAKDASGNVSDTCHVTLRVNRLTDAEFYGGIKFPIDLVKADQTAISCIDAPASKKADGSFDPDKTGWPYLVYPDPNPTEAEDDALDTQDTVILDNGCTFTCELAATYVDVKINTCNECIEKTLRIWTVVENSCQYPERYLLNRQTIEVVDTIPPVIVCPEDVEVTTNTIGNFGPTSAGDLDCGARFFFPVPEMSDECKNYTVWSISVTNDLGQPVMFADTNETKTTVSRDLPYGVNTVEYIAYDACGNSASCTWTVTVVDHTPPVAVCQQFTTASLTYDGEAELPADVFDSGSYDDCSIDHFGVRRMDNKIDCEGHVDNNVNHFFDYVTFCCDDIANNDITVIMRVWDKGGRWNDCMIQVNVQDKLPPTLECPPNICVECEYPFVIDEMENYFGKVAIGYDNRETTTIGGDFGSFYLVNDICGTPQTDFKFKDGWVYDNCLPPSVGHEYVDQRNQCGEGNIVRTFSIGSRECDQIIHFFNPDPFGEEDITWPSDVTVTGCYNETNYPPEQTGGYPILKEDNCDLAGSSYNDIVFHFNDDNFDAEGVCFKIIRKWTVMDWCQKYTDGPFKGQFVTWHHDQVIMISETEDPTFTTPCEDKEICTYDGACEKGYIELTMSAEDNCTLLDNLKWRYRIDYNNDGSFDVDSKLFPGNTSIISGETANASGDYPIGKHRIIWTVWDQCGNTATCDKFFTIKNCKKPTPRCVDHVVIEMMPLDAGTDGVADWAMIEVGAQLVEVCCTKSSHPCGYPLKYSFSADTNDVLRGFYCSYGGDDLAGEFTPGIPLKAVNPAVGALEDIEMWVTAILPDGTITQDNCITHIDFQDNNEACQAAEGLIEVSGTITTTEDEPISNVSVEVQGSELAPVNTIGNGTYEFTVNTNRSFIVAPSKDDNDLAGVSTLDIVLIQKHILGSKTIDNPYTLLAANINKDNGVKVSDILKLRKLILGTINDIGDAWMFVDKDYVFENAESPYNENIKTATAINSDEDLVVNFYGIKMGDIDNSLNVLESRSSESLELAIDAMDVEPGQVEVPVYASNINDVKGFQYTFKFDPSVMSFEGIESGKLMINNSNIGVRKAADGVVAISWNSENLDAIASDEALFTLKFNAVSNAKLQNVLSISSDIARKEAYNANLDVMGVELEYRGAEVEFALYQNTPNPFSVYTDISFDLPESSKGTITIYDLTGKVLRTIEGNYEKGTNTVRIKKADLNVSGVMYYRLETEGFTATKKMILIK